MDSKSCVASKVVRRAQSSVSLILQRTDGASQISKNLFEDVTSSASPAAECIGYEGYLHDHLVFGGQTPYVANYSARSTMAPPEPLRARVDNCALYSGVLCRL